MAAHCLPVRTTIPVNMNTLRLEVRRAADHALITRDRMRVDVLAEFYVRVQPTAESIADGFLVLCVSAGIQFMQLLMITRDGDLYDFSADLTGVALGTAIGAFLTRRAWPQ